MNNYKRNSRVIAVLMLIAIVVMLMNGCASSTRRERPLVVQPTPQILIDLEKAGPMLTDEELQKVVDEIPDAKDILEATQ